ncbi:MAG: cupin domain-containing protein [bacterium]|nr:cupin domain-containing protein [Planctomycetota bacterium]HIL52939.1 cupin domain-containing protein [Planctomycetota bacterium]
MCGHSACLRFVSTPDVVVEELPFGPHEWLVRGDITESRQLMCVRVSMPPGQAHQFHRHPHFEEFIYCISGRLEQWVGEESRVLSAGDVAHVPMDEVHGSYNLFDETAVFIAVMSPAEFEGPVLVDVSREEPWCSLKPPFDPQAPPKSP